MHSDSSVYISSKDKYEDLNSSGTSLLVVGLILAVLLAVDLSRIIKLPINSSSRILTDSVLAVLSAACLCGSHSTLKKANILKAAIASEQKQRQQIINWCTSTYSALHIDKMIEAAETAAGNRALITSIRIKVKLQIEIPQSM